MRMTIVLGLGCLAGLTGVVSAAPGDDERVAITPRVPPPDRSSRAPGIRVEVGLILVPVTVTDAIGAPVSGLPQAAFRLFEDGVEQRVRYFSTQDAAVSMGIVFDASRSMEGKLDESRAAVAQFFRTAVAGDEFFLVEFNDRPNMIFDFTEDAGEIERTLAGIVPRNWTALFDAVYFATRHVRNARNARKALLILSDGGDNRSRYTEAEMKALVRETDVCIYSIALGGGLSGRNIRLLRGLSEETGGILQRVSSAADLPAAMATVSAAIRNQYVLGYFSNNPRKDGLYRRIQIELNHAPDQERFRATWRNGYYAPHEFWSTTSP